MEVSFNWSSWWFHIFLMFTPIWGRFPFWRAYFSKGFVQTPTSDDLSAFLTDVIIPLTESYPLTGRFVGYNGHQGSRAEIKMEACWKKLELDWALFWRYTYYIYLFIHTLIFQFPIYLEPSSQLPIYQATCPLVPVWGTGRWRYIYTFKVNCWAMLFDFNQICRTTIWLRYGILIDPSA